MEKAKSRGNFLSFKVDQGIGGKVVGQQPHHTEGQELKQDGPFFWIKPEGYLFWYGTFLEASHFRSKGWLLSEEFYFASPWEYELLCF